MVSDNGAYDSKRSVTQVEGGLWQIDIGFQGRAGVIAAYLLTDGREAALIETGPASCLPNLLEGVRRAGLPVEMITSALVTHIHLDHAGAAGVLARANPNLKVYVHPFGAPHLADPARLIASATRIYGDRMEMLWGEIAPVPRAQIVELVDDETLKIAGRALRVLFTPGHAWHHAAFVDLEEGTAFTGDVGGVRMTGTDYVCAPTPPPDLDDAAWRASIAKLTAMHVRRLYLTHFGAYDDAPRQLDAVLTSLREFLAIGDEVVTAETDQAALTARLHAAMSAGIGAVPAGILENLEWATPSYMAALGLTRYFSPKSRALRAARP